nr:dethiobiotin synthase [Fusobacterium gastrosuis]
MNFKSDFFVIGTDTDVGKTYVSSLLYHSLNKYNFFYYKPVQSGCYEKNGILTAPDVASVCSVSNIPYNQDMVCYTLKEEVSPHLAAEKENIKIDIEKIKKHYFKIKEKYPHTIIEGAGGLHVPLVRNEFYIYDLIKTFNVPIILVCGTRVGSINHAMLTIKTLNSMNIKIQGLVFNNYKANFYEDDNIKVILEDSGIKNYIIIKNGQKSLEEKDLEILFRGLINE